jgi:hypothetical protein
VPENNAAMNDDTSNPDAPNDSDAPDVLDTSGAGGPTEPNKPIGVFLNAEAAVREARNRLNT